MRFTFANDDKAQAFCEEIVDNLVTRHHMMSPDANRYVELQWTGQPFEGHQDDRYHRLAEEWAGHIYKHHQYLFGNDK